MGTCLDTWLLYGFWHETPSSCVDASNDLLSFSQPLPAPDILLLFGMRETSKSYQVLKGKMETFPFTDEQCQNKPQNQLLPP